jgi:RING-type zinc-finger
MEDSSSSRVDDGEIELYSETIEIRRSILCIICLGTYFNPVRLPCSHTFCGHCILEASRIKLRCPICSAEFSKRSINRVPNIAKVIEDIDALVKSLTADDRFSIPIEKLDEQYRQRQRAVRSENQNNHLISTSTLQPEIFDQQEILSELCGTNYRDVDTTSSYYVELVTNDLSESPSSSSDDWACVGPASSIPSDDIKEMSPLLSPNMPYQKQSLNTDMLPSETALDPHLTGDLQVSGGTDYASMKPDRETAPISRKDSDLIMTETSDVVPTLLPARSRSSVNTSDLLGNTAHILLSTESTTAAAQSVLEKCSGINIADTVFRPGEVVEVSSRMWPGQGISIFFPFILHMTSSRID